MYRRAIVSAVALIALLAACGRQITPSSTQAGLVAGTMRIRFDTAGVMNFTSYRYAIVFNTSGNGQEPFANAFTTSLLNYSFVWVVGTQGGTSVSPVLEQIYPITNGIQSTYVSVPSQLVQFTPNSNGQGNEFTLQFYRSLFNTVPPDASPTPTTAAGVTPEPTASTTAQSTWYVNVFTIDANNNIIDAGGLGVNDTSFSLPIDTTMQIDNASPFNKAGAPAVADTAAQITGGEIINAPDAPVVATTTTPTPTP